MNIFIYAGKGVNSFSLRETLFTFRKLLPECLIKSISYQSVLEGSWQRSASLFIMPGGRDVPYDRSLRGLGTKNIRNFVEKGGVFLGICAGAYFATREVIFEKGTSLEVHENRQLQFFPGAAIGTLFRSRPFEYRSERGAQAPLIQLENEALPLYYNGGCYFSKAQSYPVKVIGTYQAYQDKAAIISCQVGKGTAFLSGVHFEVRPEALSKKKIHTEIYSILTKSEERRQVFLQSVLDELNLRV